MARTALASAVALLVMLSPIGAAADEPPWARDIPWQHDTIRLPVSGSTLVVPSDTYAAVGPAAITVLNNLTDRAVPDPKAVDAVLVAGNFADYVLLQYYDTGYIRDDDWKSLKPDDLYAAIAAKIPPAAAGSQIHLQGWLQPPSFDSRSADIRWAVSLKAGEKPMANYKILKLGRSGYEAFTWATLGDASAGNLLDDVYAGYAFGPDQRYADHQDTDRMANFGVGGLAKAAAAGDPFPQAAIAFGFTNIILYVMGAALVGILLQLFINAGRPAND